MATGKHALIFGASGISGNSLCNELLVYPTKDTFARIVGLTNRPLTVRDAYLPEDPRLELISGIDLSKSLEYIKTELEKKVKDIHEITHVFFMAYVQEDGWDALRKTNVPLLQKAIEAVDELSPNLEHVILQTGRKTYGIEFVDKIKLNPPFSEASPRIPSPYAKNIFYYGQVDALDDLSKGKKWKWTEVRPDVIVGFVPGTNAMNVAGPLAYWLSLYRYVHGEGAEVPFPSSEIAWQGQHTDTSAYILSRFEIYAALNGDKTASGAFNIADGEISSWAKKWPGICEYFRLTPGRPAPSTIKPEVFFKKHANVWDEIVKKYGLVNREETSWWFFQGCLSQEFDRHFDLSAARKVGFTETVDTLQMYTQVFDKMRKAKFIP